MLLASFIRQKLRVSTIFYLLDSVVRLNYLSVVCVDVDLRIFDVEVVQGFIVLKESGLAGRKRKRMSYQRGQMVDADFELLHSGNFSRFVQSIHVFRET